MIGAQQAALVLPFAENVLLIHCARQVALLLFYYYK
jgi:hypothetical protein